jgi:DNA-binding transcriptional MerR regulator
MNKNDFISTGEFAKLTGVTKQTLLHYDKMGIFKPSIVDVNNYRYYSFTQLETFTVISMLREMNVPISEIKAHLEKGTPEKLLEMLKRNYMEIDEKIEKLIWCKKCISEKINVTKEALSYESDKIYIQDLPAEYMIRVKTNQKMPKDEKNVSQAVINLFNYCKEIGAKSSFAVGGIIPVTSITDSSFSYSHLYKVVEKSEGLENLVLDSSGLFLVYYSDEGYTKIIENTQKLLKYGRDHGLTLGSCFYEDTLLDDLSSRDYSHYKVKLSIKILGGLK